MNSLSRHFRIALYASLVCVFMLGAVQTVHGAPTKAAVSTSNAKAASSSPVDPGFTLSPLPDAVVYNDFVVGPGKIELSMNPGESRTVEVTVANRLGTPKSFSLTEEDFTGSNDFNQPVVLLGDDRGPYSLKDFIHIGASVVDVPHAEKAFVPVTIQIPANAQPGGLYGSIIVSATTRPGTTASDPGQTTASNPIITRLATLFFVRVAGSVKEAGSLEQFNLSGNKKLLLDNGPLNFDLVFKNSGDVFLVPSGAITITNMLGSSMGSINVDPWFAMPGTLRFREVAWNPPFLFGRYTAHAVVKRGYGSTTDGIDTVFWVIPWKIILAILVGLFIVISGIRWLIMHVRIVPKNSSK